MTVKEKDGENDSGSNLDRNEIFRVNLDVHKATFRKLFGTIPKRPGKVETVSMQYDFSSTDCILPHPVYVWVGWICSLSPSKKTFGELKLLIQETYDYAREKCAKKKLSFLSIARLELPLRTKTFRM